MTTLLRLVVLAIVLLILADNAPAFLRYAGIVASSPAAVDKAIVAMTHRQQQLDAAIEQATK